MASVTEVAESIYLIETEASQVLGTSGFPLSSLVYYIAAERPAIVETGPAIAVTQLLGALRRLGNRPALSYAILTHVHLDHSGGAGILAQQLAQVKIVAHRRGVRHVANPSRLIEASRQAFGVQFEEQYGPIVPVPDRQIVPVEDGDTVDLGDRKLTIIYAPGHASHHICACDKGAGALFCGEALGRPQSTVVAPVSGFDPDAALDTIARLGSLNAQVAFYSHGGISREPGKLIESVRANMTAYRAIILEGARAGEPRPETIARLDMYQKEHSSTGWNSPRQVEDLLEWHIAYFKRKGLV